MGRVVNVRGEEEGRRDGLLHCVNYGKDSTLSTPPSSLSRNLSLLVTVFFFLPSAPLLFKDNK